MQPIFANTNFKGEADDEADEDNGGETIDQHSMPTVDRAPSPLRAAADGGTPLRPKLDATTRETNAGRLPFTLQEQGKAEDALDRQANPSTQIQQIWGLFGTLTNDQRNSLLRGLLERSASSQVEQVLKSLNLKASAKFGGAPPVLHGLEEHPKIVAFASKAGAVYRKADVQKVRETIGDIQLPLTMDERPGDPPRTYVLFLFASMGRSLMT